MAPARKTLLKGSATFVVGLALWLFGLDEEIVVITPSKVGVVLMVLGGAEMLYGIYRSTRREDAARG